MTQRLGVGNVDLGAVTLAYETQGAGEPPLLLVHGYTGSKLDWTDVMGTLARHRRVVAYDHRGHGDSTNTGDPASYTFDALLGDLESFVDTVIGDQPFHLLGHSMGGVIALRYVLAHPERVGSLILMDSFSEPVSVVPAAARASLVTMGRDRGMAAMAELLQQFVGSSGVVPPDRVEVIGERLRWKIEQLDIEAFGALGEELSTFPALTTRLDEISCPTTVIVGENDMRLREPSDRLAASIAGAQLRVVAGAAHSPQEERPDAWLAAVGEHFTRV